jgi:sulfate transport system ATP-binding protein
MHIDIEQIDKRFGAFVALDGVSLNVRSGELIALLGPSGSGKTTLLRIIAGLETADRGDVRFDGESALGQGVRARRVGFVFQHYALFRHMTVFENIAFGLRVRPPEVRPGKAEIRNRVNDLLRLVQIEGLSQHRPAQLSGGQRQRVALARALAIEPKVLLLDEPFGALDAKVRKELRRWLRRLHEQMGMTSVFVTHDQEEALELADRVVIMGHGRVEQVGTPGEVYERPASSFVYEFLGNVNRLHCVVRRGAVEVPNIAFNGGTDIGTVEGRAVIYVRPHEIELRAGGNGEATICGISTVGPVVRIEVALLQGQTPLDVELSPKDFRALDLRLGDRVAVRALGGKVFADS